MEFVPLRLFDNQSIAFLLMPGMVAALLAQLLNWRINGDMPGVRWWSIGLAVQALGVVIRASNPIESDAIGIVGINVLILGGQFILLYGLCRFAGRPMFVKTTIATLAALVVGLFYFTAIEDSLLARTVMFAAVLAVGCGLQFSLLPPIARREGWAGVVVLVIAYGLTFVGITLRGIALAIYGVSAVGHMQLGETLSLGGRQAITSLIATAIATGYSYGYILLVTSRSRWQLRQMAILDALTGAPNRRAFDAEIMHAALRVRRDKTRLGLALLDLDHFKQVNDTYGHAAGDALLRHFAAVVRETLRETDFFARIGGEEFALVVTDAGFDSIHLAAERIRAEVEQRAMALPDGAAVRITVSAGTAVAEPGDGDVEALYRAADAALYRAKAHGRNQVERAAVGLRIEAV